MRLGATFSRSGRDPALREILRGLLGIPAFL